MRKLIITAALATFCTAGLALAAPSEASAQEFYGQRHGDWDRDGRHGRHDGRWDGRGNGHHDRRPHRPSFQTQVIETYYEQVATFSWQFDYGCYKWVQVQTGWTWELRSQTRTVTVFWYGAWNSYAYYNRQGSLTVFTRW